MSQPPYPPQHGQPPRAPRHGQQYGQQPYGQQFPPPPPPGHASPRATDERYASHRAPAPQEPPRRRRKWPWILGAVVALFVVIGIANGGSDQTSTAPAAAPTVAPTAAALPTAAAPAAPAAPEPADSGTDTITYEVTGDGVSKANNITYVKDSNFGQQQENGAALPWSTTIEFENGMFDVQPLSLVAQSGSGGSGSITCRILRNGEEVTSSTSSGPYAVVTCAG